MKMLFRTFWWLWAFCFWIYCRFTGNRKPQYFKLERWGFRWPDDGRTEEFGFANAKTKQIVLYIYIIYIENFLLNIKITHRLDFFPLLWQFCKNNLCSVVSRYHESAMFWNARRWNPMGIWVIRFDKQILILYHTEVSFSVSMWIGNTVYYMQRPNGTTMSNGETLVTQERRFAKLKIKNNSKSANLDNEQ